MQPELVDEIVVAYGAGQPVSMIEARYGLTRREIERLVAESLAEDYGGGGVNMPPPASVPRPTAPTMPVAPVVRAPSAIERIVAVLRTPVPLGVLMLVLIAAVLFVCGLTGIVVWSSYRLTSSPF
ncbi:hypothetical protein [Micromonospora sonneratiae]|uniref:Sigma-70, region 4 n=1 Tax=Micromonospora sonneratiae TaxID=1184706 RepID=A0ABW3YG66_9ACTN